MYGYRTLTDFNDALSAAGLGRFTFTQDEWMFGCDSRKAYTMVYCSVEAALARYEKETTERLNAKRR